MRALGLPDPPPAPAEPGRLRAVAAAVTATAVAGGLMLTGHFALYTYLAPLLQELGGLDARARALLLLVFGLGGLLGIAVSGPLSDRFPRHALLAVGAALAPGVAASGLVGAGGAAAAAALGFWGVLIGLLPPVFMTRLLRLAPPGHAATVGAVGVAVLNIGIAAGATAGGAVVDLAGVRALPGAGAGTVAVACAVLLGAAVRRGTAVRTARTAPPGPAAPAAATRRTRADRAG